VVIKKNFQHSIALLLTVGMPVSYATAFSSGKYFCISTILLNGRRANSSEDHDSLFETRQAIRRAEKTQRCLTPEEAAELASPGEQVAVDAPQRPLTFKDYVGSVPAELQQLTDILKNKELRAAYKAHRLMPSTGIILYGPPGTGKTYLVRCLAGELSAPCNLVNAPDLTSPFAGRTSESVRQLFEEARKAAQESASGIAIICIDEIDTIGSKRSSDTSSSGVLTDRAETVNSLLTSIDGLATPKETVIVIGITNNKGALDPALTRAGRLETHIQIDKPNAKGRAQLLTHYMHYHNVKSSDTAEQVDDLAGNLTDATAADISKLVKDALRIIIDQKLSSPTAEDSFGVKVKSLLGLPTKYTPESITSTMVIEQITTQLNAAPRSQADPHKSWFFQQDDRPRKI